MNSNKLMRFNTVTQLMLH